jgi:hypothetical protein
MRRFMSLLVVVVVVLVAVGIYRDWFGFSAQRGDTDDKHMKVILDVDTEKIKTDAKAAEDKAAEVGKSVKDRITKPSGDKPPPQ